MVIFLDHLQNFLKIKTNLHISDMATPTSPLAPFSHFPHHESKWVDVSHHVGMETVTLNGSTQNFWSNIPLSAHFQSWNLGSGFKICLSDWQTKVADATSHILFDQDVSSLDITVSYYILGTVHTSLVTCVQIIESLGDRQQKSDTFVRREGLVGKVIQQWPMWMILKHKPQFKWFKGCK